MSNVAVASDSLQMSQQLARYSQQRWVAKEVSRVEGEHEGEERCEREEVCE